ncbi:hypothetical protein BKI52_13490 [marine bacterium AO1-C]|nr:hypothetical protein BKI52_13490 [marine bacterium AO1-C]
MRTLHVFTLLLCCSVYTFGQISTKEKAAVDQIFAQWNKPGVPGCGLGIIKNGKLVYARGYGMANLEYALPNTPTSVFRIGSTSKQFTAACIVLLAKQGKLKLTNTLNQFFPAFPAYAKKITVQHLLNHTSGIRDYLLLASLKGLESDSYYTDEDLMQWLVNQKELNFAPGDDYLYSNSGYWLLGQIVGKVAGMNMADFAKKEIFEPLGMANTHFHNDHNQIVKKRASGYMPRRKGGYRISMTTLNMIGDGGIFTTIEDIKKWDDAFYKHSTFDQEFWRLMTKQGVLNNGREIDYASGLMIDKYKGLKTVSHGGAFVGFRAELLRFPKQRFSVAIFTNRGDANPTGMAYQVADVLLKDQFEQQKTSSQGNSASATPKPIKLSKKSLEKFDGHYWNDARSYSRKIYVKNDTLRYFRSAASESSLVPIGNNQFKMLVRGNVVVKFNQQKSGKYDMVFVVNGREIASSYQYTPKTYSAKEIKKFAGNYYSDELDIYYQLKLRNDALQLFIDGKEQFATKPVMENFFSNPRFGSLQFQLDNNGKVKSFRLASGRVKNLKFVRK